MVPYNALWLGITTEISGGKRKLTSKVVEMKILFRLPYNRIFETSHVLLYISGKKIFIMSRLIGYYS